MADTPLDDFEQAALEQERERRHERAVAASLRRAYAEIDRLNEQLDLVSAVDDIRVTRHREWKRPAKRSRGHKAIANLVLSDLHLDEKVSVSEMGGANAYDRRIAELRLRRTFERFIVVCSDYMAGITYESACVPLLGDLFSGNIHEELARTNDAPSILDSVEHWIDPMVAGLRMVADEFGSVHVPCIAGNHGRNTYKPIHKGSVRDNYDWLFCRQVARALADDRRITFDIPDATWTQTTQYGTTFHYEHGDRGFRGGGGVGGIFPPLLRADLKLRRSQAAVGKAYDVLVIGHFHQYLPVPSAGFIVNGSLKGWDEYARDNKFGFEVPQQAMWLTTPEHGVTFSAPIRPSDPTSEGWVQ